MSVLLLFAFGAILGSFVNVIIYRLPRGESLIRPGSRCPRCGTPIRALDNIPIVSFLVLRGRCRTCGGPIAWRYPLVEATAGALLVAIWLRDGSWVDILAGGVFVLALLAVFFIDLASQIVPNAITYPGIVIGVGLAVVQGRPVDGLLSALGAGLLFFIIAVVSRGGMGGGDVKLAAMMGAFLGWPAIAVAILIAFTTGAAAGLLLIILRLRSRKDPIPFGPALAVGGTIAWFLADPIVTWYVGM